MKKILNKILEEINKESPRLDYIRGLIEGSIEEETTSSQNFYSNNKTDVVKDANMIENKIMDEKIMDEAAILNSLAAAGLEKAKANTIDE